MRGRGGEGDRPEVRCDPNGWALPVSERVREGGRGTLALVGLSGQKGRMGRGKKRKGREGWAGLAWGRVRSLFCFFFKSFSNQIFKPFFKSIFHTNFSNNF
jgi:hypothetical protein